MPIRLPFRAAWAALLLGAALAGPAASQAMDPYNLEERLQRIEQQLRDLQDQLYQGGTPDGGGGASIQRMNDLEQSIRTLTGQVEQLGFEVRTVRERLDGLEKEMNFRLNQLEGNPTSPPGDAPSGDPATPPPSDGGGPAPKPPGTIGDVEEPPPGSTAESIYNKAMDHLTRAEYDDALKLFRQVVDNYPDTDYAAQSQYWIADIYYVQKDYERAALSFAEVLKKYPNAGRGPEAMLKLGMSLINLGKTKEGCTTLKALKGQYPNASDAILSRAEREAKKAGCK